uniref:F-box domain-containing protein n=1 Tax=Ditylenchus dipsaci TaxID=166011 RepID=A0A915CZG0_9BILA
MNNNIYNHCIDTPSSSTAGLKKSISPVLNGLSNGMSNGNFFANNDYTSEQISSKAWQARSWISQLSRHDKEKFIAEMLLDIDEQPVMQEIHAIVEERLRRAHVHGEPFAKLPRHLRLHILGLLDPVSLCNCMRVCKFWRKLCCESTLWRSLCHRPKNYRLCSLEMESEHLKKNTLIDGTVKWKEAFSQRYRLWRNWHAGRCVIRNFVGHDQGVSCVQFDSERIVSGSTDSTIRIWDLKNNTGSVGQMTLTGHSATVRCLHLHKNRLASGSNDFSIKIWDLTVNPTWSHIACRRTLLGHTNLVRCLQMVEDKLVSGSYDHTLKIWSIETGQCITTLQGHSDSVLCLQCNKSEGRIVSGSADNSIRCWDERAPPQCVMTVHNAHESAVTCLKFDNQRIVSGSVDRTIKMWELQTGKCVQTIDWKLAEGHTAVVRCLQTDAWRIVSASDDKTIKVWKLSDGERLCTLQGHTDGVTCVQFDDNRIVSGSYDKTMSNKKMNTKTRQSSSSSSASEEDGIPEQVEMPCRLAMFDFNQCDPKRCSGRKLQRHGLIYTQKLGTKFPGLVLSPTGKSTLSPADRAFVLSNGLAVVDCSWNQVEQTPLQRIKVGIFCGLIIIYLI